jgi:hypothetical protein
MTSLGLGADGCYDALGQYLERVRALGARLEGAAANPAGALAEYEELRFRLEVDVQARATLEGQARMTEVERRVLEPALRDVRVALQGVGFAVAAALPAVLRDVEGRLKRARGALRVDEHEAVDRSGVSPDVGAAAPIIGGAPVRGLVEPDGTHL